MPKKPNSSREESLENDDGLVSRRTVIRSLGVAGGVGFAGQYSARAKASTPNPSKSYERIEGNELLRAVRTAARRTDVANLIDADVRQSVLEGQLVHRPFDDEHLAVMTTAKNPTQAPVKEGHLGDGEVHVGAARHELENGNRMTAVAFVTPASALWYYRYVESEGGIKSKANLWDVVDGGSIEESQLRLAGSSVNGRPPTAAQDDLTTNACSGCTPGPSPGGYMENEDCTNVNLGCAVWGCSGCALCYTNVFCWLACLGIHCPGTIAFCCTDWETNCAYCCGMYC